MTDVTQSAAPRSRSRVPVFIAAAAAVPLLLGAALLRHQTNATNEVALAATPKGVTVVKALPARWREERRYVGTVQPWLEARVGPQLVSAYVDTVLVRPGDLVHRGDVVATLDCRNATTTSESVTQQAHALEERQRAMASEAARLEQLKGGGFVSENEIEQKLSQAAANQASLESLRAQMRSKSLEVSDCALRAPFDGEVATRSADPGSFVRPGSAIVTLVDRHLLRVVVDAPEVDFADLPTGTPVAMKLLATGEQLVAAVSRRAPSAWESTRTVRFEVDLKDVKAPVGTTADVRVGVGAERDAVEIPLVAARVRGEKASLYTVKDDVAHRLQVPVLGERGGQLFVGAPLVPGAMVVTEGRGPLTDNDAVVSRLEASAPAAEAPPPTAARNVAVGAPQ